MMLRAVVVSSRRRTLTAHEAARIQSFPDWFRFRVEGAAPRRVSSRQSRRIRPRLLLASPQGLLSLYDASLEHRVLACKVRGESEA